MLVIRCADQHVPSPVSRLSVVTYNSHTHAFAIDDVNHHMYICTRRAYTSKCIKYNPISVPLHRVVAAPHEISCVYSMFANAFGRAKQAQSDAMRPIARSMHSILCIFSQNYSIIYFSLRYFFASIA